MAVASVYMPAGLDTQPLNSGQHQMAQNIYDFVDDYVGAHSMFLIGGDLNETRKGGLDRRMGGAAKDRRKINAARKGCLIEKFVGPASRYTDIFRLLHHNARRFTRRRNGSASRLDYFIVPTASTSDPQITWTSNIHGGTTHSDHCPVRVSLEAPTSSIPACPPAAREAWRPDFPRLDRASKAQEAAVATACQAVILRSLRKWERRRGRDTRRSLERDTRAFLYAIRRTASRVVPSGHSGQDNHGPLAPIELERARCEAAKALRDCIEDINAGDLDPGSQRHRSAVGEFQRLLGRRPADQRDLPRLSKYLDTFDGKKEERMAAAWAEAPAKLRQDRRMRACFLSRPKQFVSEYLRGGETSFTIDRATRPDGTVTWDFSEYQDIVRRKVFKPMGTKIHLNKVAAPKHPDPSALTGPSPPSEDAHSLGVRPSWWDAVYSRGAKMIPAAIYRHLMDPVSEHEMEACVRAAEGGKSPGPDGCSIDLFKLLVASESTLGCRPACAQALAALSSRSIALRHIPPVLKEGWLTLVPKPKEGGSFSTEPDEMRPITVLPELAKLTSRILARRLGEVLLEHSHILDAAQRAFIRDGCVDQCVNVLTDVIEDWKQRALTDKTHPLYLLSYDQAKAYDSVQAYSIRASLERFNLPASFIKLVLSGLSGAPSRVRTHGGLSRKFNIQSSVRQGDPLAPLIYILVTDALHAGLRHNPLFPDSTSAGYKFAQGPNTTVYSSGYADDAAIFCDDKKGVSEMHAWVRAFFGAHCFTLNCTKTKYLCSSRRNPPHIASVDGLRSVTPAKKGATIRYLGAWVNLRLSWKKQLEVMDKAVVTLCNNMTRYRFALDISVFAVQQRLLPQLRLGLAMVPISHAKITGWDARIRKAALKGAGISMRSVMTESLYLAAGIPRLQDHLLAIRVEELMVTLNASYPSSSTCWARLGGSIPQDDTALADAAVHSRATKSLLAAKERNLGVSLTDPTDRLPAENTLPRADVSKGTTWRPHSIPHLTTAGVNSAESDAVTQRLYTDGSTGKDRGAPSGCSVVAGDGQAVGPAPPTLTLKHGFAVNARDNNYIAELVAILSALVVTLEHLAVHILTDSLSAIQSINSCRKRVWSDQVDTAPVYTGQFRVPQRKRILTAARPILNSIRRIISTRTGHVTLSHVRAHTEGLDLDSRMNEAADRVANEARVAADPGSHYTSDYAGEEKVSLRVGGVNTCGSYRKAILRKTEKQLLKGLSTRGNGHQNLLARTHGGRLLTFCKCVRRISDPALLRYALLVICRMLPTETALTSKHRGSQNSGRGPNCKLCGAASESVEHVYCECTRPGLVAARAASALRATATIAKADGQAAPGKHIGEYVTIQAWYDPTGHTTLQVCPAVSKSTLKKLSGYDKFAGAIGINPPNVDEVLMWARTADGGWRKCDLGETQERVVKLQASLAWSGLALWKARCGLMDAWWNSPRSCAERAARRLTEAKRLGKAAARREQKLQAKKTKGDADTRHNPRPQRSEASKQRQHNPFLIRDECSMEASLGEQEAWERLGSKHSLKLPHY